MIVRAYETAMAAHRRKGQAAPDRPLGPEEAAPAPSSTPVGDSAATGAGAAVGAGDGAHGAVAVVAAGTSAGLREEGQRPPATAPSSWEPAHSRKRARESSVVEQGDANLALSGSAGHNNGKQGGSHGGGSGGGSGGEFAPAAVVAPVAVPSASGAGAPVPAPVLLPFPHSGARAGASAHAPTGVVGAVGGGGGGGGGGPSTGHLSTDPAALWPLPPHVLASQVPAGPGAGVTGAHDAALSDLLNAWYWSGFYAGRFSALRGTA
jgi:hypothetical protein